MLKQTARFACLALLMFAASATPLMAKTASLQFDGPNPYPPLPPPPTANPTQFDGPNPYPPLPPALTAKATQFDGPNPYPPLPPASQSAS
jgi:hypothetical protein